MLIYIAKEKTSTTYMLRHKPSSVLKIPALYKDI